MLYTHRKTYWKGPFVRLRLTPLTPRPKAQTHGGGGGAPFVDLASHSSKSSRARARPSFVRSEDINN